MRGNNDLIMRIEGKPTYDKLVNHILRLRNRTVVVPPLTAARTKAGIPATVDLTQNRRNLESPEAYGD
jgi:hypothetical protein